MSQHEFEDYPLFQNTGQDAPRPQKSERDEAALWEDGELERWSAEKEAARREAEEKKRWIARRRAEDRAKLLRKIGRLAALILPLPLLLAAVLLLGIPGYEASRAGHAAQAGNYARAEEYYRKAADYRLYNALFHADRKADQMASALRLESCTAGVEDSEIPKDAVRLTGTADGLSGPITVELIVDSQKIYRVSVLEHSEQDEIGGEAARQIPGRIFRAQRVDVDAVTGATISSQGICNAAAKALNSDAAWIAGVYAWRFGAIPAMPSPSPTMGPAPEDVKVFYYENELEEFTEKVGESVRLRAVAYPESEFSDASFRWSVSDPLILKISVSESTRECVVLCLKHRPGTVTLTVDCNGVTRDILIYTRD